MRAAHLLSTKSGSVDQRTPNNRQAHKRKLFGSQLFEQEEDKILSFDRHDMFVVQTTFMESVNRSIDRSIDRRHAHCEVRTTDVREMQIRPRTNWVKKCTCFGGSRFVGAHLGQQHPIGADNRLPGQRSGKVAN